MKKIKNKPQSVKGAVLIMVMTVMFVLIFLLAGTIAVVYSANNAQMNRYMQSQAYYTSKSILDTFMFTFIKDNEVTVPVEFAQIKDGNNGSGESIKVFSSESKIKQGRALELDFYNIPVDLVLDKADYKKLYGTEKGKDGIQPVFDYSCTTKSVSDGSSMVSVDDYKVNEAPEWAEEYILQLATGKELAVTEIIDTYAPGATRPSKYLNDAQWAADLFKAQDYKNYGIYEHAIFTAQNAINPSVGTYQKPENKKEKDAGFDNPVPAFDSDPQPYSKNDSSLTYNVDNFHIFYDQYIPKDVNGNLVSASTSPANLVDTVVYYIDSDIMQDWGYGTGEAGGHKLIDSDSDAYIYVKILERKYNLGKGESFKQRFDNGKRTDDYFKLLITCTVPYDGKYTETSVVYKSTLTIAPPGNGALRTNGSIGASSSGMPISGGIASLSSKLLSLNATSLSGSAFVKGPFNQATSGTIKLQGGSSIVCLGDYYTSNDMVINPVDPGSFVYIGGTVVAGQQIPDSIIAEGAVNPGWSSGKLIFGQSGSEPLPVLVNHLNVVDNGAQIHGNVYANTIQYLSGNDKKLDVSGKIYTNNLFLSKNLVSVSSVDVSGATKTVVSINNNWKIHTGSSLFSVADRVVIKDYYDVDTIDPTEEEVALGITKKDLVLYTKNGNFSMHSDTGITVATDETDAKSKHVYMNYYDAEAFGGELNEDNKKVFTMPDGEQFALETALSKFEDIYDKSAFYVADDVDALKNAVKGEAPDSDSAKMKEYKYVSGHIGDTKEGLDETALLDYTVSAESKAASVTGSNTCKISTSNKLAANTNISSGMYIFPKDTNLGDIVMDTSNGDVTVMFEEGGGYYYGNIKIVGGGHATFLVPETAAGTTAAQYNFGSTAYDLRIEYMDSQIITDGNGVVLNPTSSSLTATTPPDVDFFIGTNSNIKTYRGTYLTGVFYAPRSRVEISSDSQGASTRYIDGNLNIPNQKYWLFGSCTCNQYLSQNLGIAYIPNDIVVVNPTLPILKWKNVIYTRE